MYQIEIKEIYGSVSNDKWNLTGVIKNLNVLPNTIYV